MEGRIGLMWPLMSRSEQATAVAVMLAGGVGGMVAAEAVAEAGKKRVDTMKYARTGASVAFFMLELAREK